MNSATSERKLNDFDSNYIVFCWFIIGIYCKIQIMVCIVGSVWDYDQFSNYGRPGGQTPYFFGRVPTSWEKMVPGGGLTFFLHFSTPACQIFLPLGCQIFPPPVVNLFGPLTFRPVTQPLVMIKAQTMARIIAQFNVRIRAEIIVQIKLR